MYFPEMIPEPQTFYLSSISVRLLNAKEKVKSSFYTGFLEFSISDNIFVFEPLNSFVNGPVIFDLHIIIPGKEIFTVIIRNNVPNPKMKSMYVSLNGLIERPSC